MNAEPASPDRFHISDGWFGPWREAYLERGTVALPIAGLPMLRETVRWGPLRYTRLRGQTNIHTARYDVRQAHAIPEDLPRLLIDRGRADLVVLDYLAEDARLLAAARGWEQDRRIAIDAMARVPVTDCRTGFARWLAARSKRDRSRWPKLEKRLIDELGLRFAVDDGRTGLDDLLRGVFAVEASGWKGSAATAILDDPRDTLFYTRLAERAAAVGALRLALLRDGERIVAFEYAVLSGDRLFVLKAAYDEAYAAHSIGHVLAMQHIRACCADDAIAWYDVLGNGLTPAAHKLRFADRTETLYRVRLYGRGPRARLLRLWIDARRIAKRVRDRRGTGPA